MGNAKTNIQMKKKRVLSCTPFKTPFFFSSFLFFSFILANLKNNPFLGF